MPPKKGEMGLEPMTYGLTDRCYYRLSYSPEAPRGMGLAGAEGVEPSPAASETAVIPFHYAPIQAQCSYSPNRCQPLSRRPRPDLNRVHCALAPILRAAKRLHTTPLVRSITPTRGHTMLCACVRLAGTRRLERRRRLRDYCYLSRIVPYQLGLRSHTRREGFEPSAPFYRSNRLADGSVQPDSGNAA